MSNIIKGVDIGMGYEQATKWEHGLSVTVDGGKTWMASGATSETSMLGAISAGAHYRRPLPILANHPEAIPLEPGQVLQVGDRGLTRDGQDTGDLVRTKNGFEREGFTLFSESQGSSFKPSGAHHHEGQSPFDIIARLPKVAREAEKAKEEKVQEPQVKLNQPVYYAPGDHINAFINASEAARLYLENESVRASVKRQEEAKRIGPLDWYWYQGAAEQCTRIVGYKLINRNGAYREICDCVKIENPDLIAALNAEIDAKAGG